MKERMKKSISLSTSMPAFVLVMFTVQTSNANPVSEQHPNSNPEQCPEVISSMVFINMKDGNVVKANVVNLKQSILP